MVLSKLEFVRLKSLQLLHEVGDSIKSAYFCNSGMISTLNVFPLKRIMPAIPILMFTAFTDSHLKAAALAAGVCEVINKLDSRTLMSSIQKLSEVRPYLFQIHPVKDVL